MDRFEWYDETQKLINEKEIFWNSDTKLYDGPIKQKQYSNGQLILTNYRLLWKAVTYSLSLLLSYVVKIEEEPSKWLHSNIKVILHLLPSSVHKKPGPFSNSSYNFIKIAINMSSVSEFMEKLSHSIEGKIWNVFPKQHTGILSIERNLQNYQEETKKTVSKAFSDLQQLMDTAESMVNLAKIIAQKIKSKQGEITLDETKQFQSYLLSLGLDDPVTRDVCKSDNHYFEELAQQIFDTIKEPLKTAGGIMTLTEVYCRINRARGLSLLSPSDLLQACQLMEKMQLPTSLQRLPSNVLVLRDEQQSEKQLIKIVMKHINAGEAVTSEELSKKENMPVALCRESLLLAETQALVCRDETVAGIRFYPNKFLNFE